MMFHKWLYSLSIIFITTSASNFSAAGSAVVNKASTNSGDVVSGLKNAYGDIEILNGGPQQGSMILARLKGEGEVFYKQKKLPLTKEGLFVFGVGRDAPSSIELIVKKSNKSNVVPIKVKSREWKIERIDGLPPSKVTPKSKDVLARISREAKLVKSARTLESDSTFFTMAFIMPAEGRISGVYGSQRVLNGQPKRPHYGLDVANKTGTPVIAPANGTVSLTHPDMYYSGGTLVIDHGFGISSTYIHLNSISVKQGQKVLQGDLIGTIGSSGRATGPHLDWRLNWFQTRLDPQLLIGGAN
ncbi:M23 family metallopeptidase [Aliikangiella coralliicola]|uniref:M23 family metallopeptidase n=1 Tax=Aliikangiella coralliicola TaxID=2592383 RepID=A0A545UD04_9GAMM|nr:M23 family metallopeptidase [Aliikangiella coralliicola]TQV87349.1 M23 family metallopeptidase [Aliikangiella coralliicola]